MIARRIFLAGSLALLGGCVRYTAPSPHLEIDFEPIRSTLGRNARLGVAALDTGTGRSLGSDAAGRYALCSTFKMPLAAAILAEVDRGALSLSDELRFGSAEIQEYAPVVRANLARGALSLEALCAAIIEVSDNEAANLLLARIGGPAALTHFIRRCGDPVTRLDRTEPSLNTNLPGDPRDTTTPEAMVGLMRRLLVEDVLTPSSRTRLLGWMEGSTTGLARLRAGLPRDWRVGDKTGTGANGATNDIAIAWPPGRKPILIAVYQSEGDADSATRNAAHASVARLVAESFA